MKLIWKRYGDMASAGGENHYYSIYLDRETMDYILMINKRTISKSATQYQRDSSLFTVSRMAQNFEDNPDDYFLAITRIFNPPAYKALL